MKRKFVSLSFVLLSFLLCGCPDVLSPGKTESEFYLAPWVIGKWKTRDESGVSITLTLLPDGSALGSNEAIGSWYFLETRVYINWVSGWIDVIEKQGNGFVKLGFAPGKPSDGTPTNRAPAEKIE